MRWINQINIAPVPASGDIVLTKQLLKEEFNADYYGDNFRSLFIGKTLRGAPAGKVAINQLKEYSTIRQISDELGDALALPLVYMLSLMKNQRNGEEGSFLHIMCSAVNLIVVEEPSSIVSVDWVPGRGWVMMVFPPNFVETWIPLTRVLSRGH